jgi:hypothetical protein
MSCFEKILEASKKNEGIFGAASFPMWIVDLTDKQRKDLEANKELMICVKDANTE